MSTSRLAETVSAQPPAARLKGARPARVGTGRTHPAPLPSSARVTT